jgi:hypothetical protein
MRLPHRFLPSYDLNLVDLETRLPADEPLSTITRPVLYHVVYMSCTAANSDWYRAGKFAFKTGQLTNDCLRQTLSLIYARQCSRKRDILAITFTIILQFTEIPFNATSWFHRTLLTND